MHSQSTSNHRDSSLLSRNPAPLHTHRILDIGRICVRHRSNPAGVSPHQNPRATGIRRERPRKGEKAGNTKRKKGRGRVVKIEGEERKGTEEGKRVEEAQSVRREREVQGEEGGEKAVDKYKKKTHIHEHKKRRSKKKRGEKLQEKQRNLWMKKGPKQQATNAKTQTKTVQKHTGSFFFFFSRASAFFSFSLHSASLFPCEEWRRDQTARDATGRHPKSGRYGSE